MLSGTGQLLAQEPQAAPPTPMSPGSSTFGRSMVPEDARDRATWSVPFDFGARPQMAPPQMPVQSPYFTPPLKPPDFSGLDSAAITLVSAGSADVVVSSRADKELILQLYRPDQKQWQEYRLAPLANTPIACPSCGGKLKFSFNNGAQDSEIDVEAPAMLRIFPDATGQLWQWDVFKLQAAAKTP